MPFTISHVAAVLPFRRVLTRFRLLSAAIVGSMVPDFGWLTPWHPPRFETHSITSLVTFSLPVGLATFWLFQRWLKEPLLEMLPAASHARATANAAPANPRDPLQWLLAAAGVLVGAATHLVWDAFTHEGARGMRLIPALDDPSVALGAHHLVGARLLQDASSIIGLALLLALCLYELRPQTALPPVERRLSTPERRGWTALYLLITGALCAALFLHHSPGTARGLSAPLSRAAIAVLRGMALGIVLPSLLLRGRLRALRRAAPAAVTRVTG